MYVNQLVLRDDNSTSGNYGITGSGLGERLYAQQDAGWNVTALMSASGAVQERFLYDPYGTKTVLNATWGSASDSFGWVYNFQDGRYDSATSLIRFGARDYSASLGTWLQPDPALYAGGPNRYQMDASNSVALLDPLGLCPCKGCKTLTLIFEHPLGFPDTGHTALGIGDNAYDYGTVDNSGNTTTKAALFGERVLAGGQIRSSSTLIL